jgi:hypothetical protein
VDKYEGGSDDAIRMKTCDVNSGRQSWKWDGSKFVSFANNQQYALSFEGTDTSGDKIAVRRYDDTGNADKVTWKSVVNPVTPGVQTIPQDYFYIQSSKYPSICVQSVSTDTKAKGKACTNLPPFQWNFSKI